MAQWDITESLFMNKLKLFLLGLSIALFITGCKSVSYVSRSIDIVREDALQTSLNAELQVNLESKVSATSDLMDSKRAALNNAYYKCIQANNIDVVIDPIVQYTKYSVFVRKEVKNSGNAKWWIPQYKAEIVGFGGKYVKVENKTEQVKQYENIDMNTVIKYKLATDPEFFKAYYNNNKTNVINVNVPQSNKKNVSMGKEYKPLTLLKSVGSDQTAVVDDNKNKKKK